MQDQIAKTKKRLNELADEILSSHYGRDRSIQEWGGADVVITSHAPQPRGGGFYAEPRYVVTPHAKPLSKLFYDLRDAFGGLLDSCSKIEFYGRLALAALNYQEDLCGKPEDTAELLKAVLYEAFAMLAQMEQGNFEFLEVAPGGVVWADLVDRAERGGYLGIEATRDFFAEMERQHRGA
jgi:hypothetical protein